jgi:hypothetical protein
MTVSPRLYVSSLIAVMLAGTAYVSSANAQSAECTVPRLAELHAKDAEAAKSEELTDEEIKAAQDCIWDALLASYAKSDTAWATEFTGWTNVATQAYQSATHGGRYVMNYANPVGADAYAKFEASGVMPAGTVLAKPSFSIKNDGKVGFGPLFFMEKHEAGFDEDAQNWKYSLIMPGGKHNGKAAGPTPDGLQFCIDCHVGTGADTDSMLYVPEQYRVSN